MNLSPIFQVLVTFASCFFSQVVNQDLTTHCVGESTLQSTVICLDKFCSQQELFFACTFSVLYMEVAYKALLFVCFIFE